MSDPKPSIDQVNGFHVAGVHCGLKKDNKLDLALILSDRLCVTAGVFTTNRVKAAPVLVNMDRLERHREHIRAVLINTGSANACTGQQGIDNALQAARWVAETIGCHENEVLVMSTGVIGTQLPMDKIKSGINSASQALSDNWRAAASAIMTTDTRPKQVSVTVTSPDGKAYQIAGIAKGAGMIAPNMATMLSVIVTDAALTSEQAQRALLDAAGESFNRIVVDGDMSTNDSLLLLANGSSGITLETKDEFLQFQSALRMACRELAQAIVRDGEGVTKFITIEVHGAPDDVAAHHMANTIATSALVKTAFFGSDANWGRIIAAAGRAGISLQPEALQLWIAAGEHLDTNGALLLFSDGMPTQYREEDAAGIMRESSISLRLDCGGGQGTATVWTCDLSHDYVSINGDYRS